MNTETMRAEVAAELEACQAHHAALSQLLSALDAYSNIGQPTSTEAVLPHLEPAGMPRLPLIDAVHAAISGAGKGGVHKEALRRLLIERGYDVARRHGTGNDPLLNHCLGPLARAKRVSRDGDVWMLAA